MSSAETDLLVTISTGEQRSQVDYLGPTCSGFWRLKSGGLRRGSGPYAKTGWAVLARYFHRLVTNLRRIALVSTEAF
jgi:hypothetical protein